MSSSTSTVAGTRYTTIASAAAASAGTDVSR